MAGKIVKRLFVYPKDIELITGRSKSHCWRLYRTMKDVYGKNPQQALTTLEVADYLGITVFQIEDYLT